MAIAYQLKLNGNTQPGAEACPMATLIAVETILCWWDGSAKTPMGLRTLSDKNSPTNWVFMICAATFKNGVGIITGLITPTIHKQIPMAQVLVNGGLFGMEVGGILRNMQRYVEGMRAFQGTGRPNMGFAFAERFDHYLPH